jgi:putative transcriptional regulator
MPKSFAKVPLMEEKVTNNVYTYRTAQALTQEELAVAVGVTRQTIISIEKGNYTPSVLLALKFAKVFSVPVEKIFILTYEK